MSPSIFVSYSHKDADFARKLVSDLTPSVKSIWFDEVSIRPGRYWDDEIEAGIKKADVMLSLLSPNLLDSRICKDEFDTADRLGKPVIPLLVAPCKTDSLWMRIARRQWIEFHINYHTGYSKLLSALKDLNHYIVPPGKKCPVCNLESETSSRVCPNCHAPYRPVSLGELAMLAPQYLQKYVTAYHPYTLLPQAQSDDLLAVIIPQILLKNYVPCKPLLERAITANPNHGYLWYLLAVVQLAGRRPRSLTYNAALEIQSLLENAINCNPNLGEGFILLALLKDDFFENKGFKVNPPSVAACINHAVHSELKLNELKILLNLLPTFESHLMRALRSSI